MTQPGIEISPTARVLKDLSMHAGLDINPDSFRTESGISPHIPQENPYKIIGKFFRICNSRTYHLGHISILQKHFFLAEKMENIISQPCERSYLTSSLFTD